MSVSNYVLNQRISVLQSEIDNLTPPSGGYVPVNGNITINDIKTFSTLPQSSVVPVSNDDLVNKLYVDTHGGGGSQNLSQVLTTGNSAGSSSIDMNTNAISNISTATAKTSLVVNNSVAGQNSTLTDKSLTVNNATLNGVPLSINNLNNAGLLFTEEYNQRTAQTGETIRNSYYAKNSAGTKTEYSRIHINTPAITAGSERGRMDFVVKDAGGLTDYIRLTGNTGQIDAYKTLHMNSNNIINCPAITTTLNNQYQKTETQFLSGSTSIYTNVEDKLQLNYINTGVPDAWTAFTGFTLPNSDVVLCGCMYSGSYYIGTSLGKIYYFNDATNIYDTGLQLNGSVFCMKEYNFSLYFGGSFTYDNTTSTSYGYLGYISSGTAYPTYFSNWGAYGFNNIVRTLETYGGYLYIGGDFTYDANFSNPINQICIFDFGTGSGLQLDSAGAYGFNGNVYGIKYDPNNSWLVFCGAFTNVNTSLGNYSNYGLIALNMSGNFVTAVDNFSGFSNSGAVNCIEIYGSNVVIGGNATMSYIQSWYWNGSQYQNSGSTPWGITPSNDVNLMLYTGTYLYVATSGATVDLYRNATNLGVALGSTAYSSLHFIPFFPYDVFSLNTSSTIPFYYYNQSDSIVVSLSSSYPVVSNGTEYNTSIILPNNGSSIALVWSLSQSKYYALSLNGAVLT